MSKKITMSKKINNKIFPELVLYRNKENDRKVKRHFENDLILDDVIEKFMGIVKKDNFSINRSLNKIFYYLLNEEIIISKGEMFKYEYLQFSQAHPKMCVYNKIYNLKIVQKTIIEYKEAIRFLENNDEKYLEKKIHKKFFTFGYMNKTLLIKQLNMVKLEIFKNFIEIVKDNEKF